MNYKKIYGFCFVFWSILQLSAQTNNLPYSRIGLGDLNPQYSVYQKNMGGIGVSLGTPAHINFANPALLIYNKLTIFDIAVSYEQRNLATAESSQNYRGGNLNYLAFAFPIAKKITLGAGFQPYSIVNYEDKTQTLLPQSATFVEYNYTGTGGITQAYGSIAYAPFKGFSVGMQANYNFGSVQNSSESSLNDGQSLYTIEALNRINFSDFSYRLGVSYRFEFENGTGINLGAATDLATDMNITRFQAIQRKDRADEAPLKTDTLLFDTKSFVRLPASYHLGISISKPRHYALGIDFKQQKWSEYEGVTAETLGDTQEIRVGAMWVPDARSISSYLKRVSYQIGFYRLKTPTIVNTQQIEDIGITAGLSLPVSPTLSSLNFGVNVGERGTTDLGLIRERYFKISVSMSVNDQWFRKRRIF